MRDMCVYYFSTGCGEGVEGGRRGGGGYRNLISITREEYQRGLTTFLQTSVLPANIISAGRKQDSARGWGVRLRAGVGLIWSTIKQSRPGIG